MHISGLISLSDQELLRRIRLKDECACKYLLCTLNNLLRNYLRKKTRHAKELAKDLSINVLSILIEKQEEPVLTTKLTTFAMAIALNQWKGMLKKKGEVSMPEGLLDQLKSEEDIYIEVERSERLLLVNSCLLKLNDKCREMLRLFSLDLDAEEVSREMGYASKKIYQVKKSECLQRLKMIIEQQPEFHELFV